MHKKHSLDEGGTYTVLVYFPFLVFQLTNIKKFKCMKLGKVFCWDLVSLS